MQRSTSFRTSYSSTDFSSATATVNTNTISDTTEVAKTMIFWEPFIAEFVRSNVEIDNALVSALIRGFRC